MTAACPRPEKRRYGSKIEAKGVIAAMYRHGDGNPDLNAYLCVCGSWHVGHNPRWLHQRIRSALRGGPGSKSRRRRGRR